MKLEYVSKVKLIKVGFQSPIKTYNVERFQWDWNNFQKSPWKKTILMERKALDQWESRKVRLSAHFGAASFVLAGPAVLAWLGKAHDQWENDRKFHAFFGGVSLMIVGWPCRTGVI